MNCDGEEDNQHQSVNSLHSERCLNIYIYKYIYIYAYIYIYHIIFTMISDFGCQKCFSFTYRKATATRTFDYINNVVVLVMKKTIFDITV